MYSKNHRFFNHKEDPTITLVSPWGASTGPAPRVDADQRTTGALCDPKQCVGYRKFNVPDTSNSSYGTVTDVVRDDRNCSSRIYIDLYRGAHKIFIQELPMSIPEEFSYKHQCRGSSRSYSKTSSGDFNSISTKSSHKDLCTRSCKSLWQHLTRISTRALHKEL